MEKGDISNEIAPRLVVVFEGLIGMLPDVKARAKESLLRKAHQWRGAVDTYEINDLTARHILDAVWRRKYSVDVVTYLGDEMADAIAERLDDEGIPVGHVWSTTPDRLSRSLAYRPDIAAIFDPNPEHRFTYGGKGYVTDPSAPSFFGAF